MQRNLAGLLTASALALTGMTARLIAAEPQPVPIGAPVNAEACKACHGRQGISLNPTFPNLAGQKAGYLENQLKAFRAKDRKNDFMNAIAGQLSDTDIHQLALYWSSQPAAPAADPHDALAKPGPAILSRMTMPATFPAGFVLYQTESQDATITKRFANQAAWKAAKAGQPLPDGSILVQESYTAEKDAGGKQVAGAVTGYAAMESLKGWGGSVPMLLRNGNWDYALFAPDRMRRDQLNQAPCLACHKPQEANSYVFTLSALKAATIPSAKM